MKYSLHINQKQAIDLGITNINQAHIFDLLTGMASWASPVMLDGVIFYWVSRQSIARELQLLNLKPDTIYRHLKSLHDLDLISYRKDGKKDCVNITDKGKTYYVGNKSESEENTMSEINPKNSENSEINPSHYVGNKSEKNSEINPTYQSTNNISLKDDQSRGARTKFSSPTETQVNTFAQTNELNLSGFFDYYESNGWMAGKNKMKNWQAAARGWHRRSAEYSKNKPAINNQDAAEQAKAAIRERMANHAH